MRPIQETARLYAKKNPVYFYRFSHEGSLFGVRERKFPGIVKEKKLLKTKKSTNSKLLFQVLATLKTLDIYSTSSVKDQKQIT